MSWRKLLAWICACGWLTGIGVSAEAVQYKVRELGIGSAKVINDAGLVAGSSKAQGLDYVTIWSSNAEEVLNIQGYAQATNNAGVIVGSSHGGGFVRSATGVVQWTPTAVLDVNSLGQYAAMSSSMFEDSYSSINDAGVMIGSRSVWVGSGYNPVVIKSSGGVVTQITGPGNRAVKINNQGTIIGTSGYRDPGYDQYWWLDANGMHDFASYFTAHDINDLGLVVGCRNTQAIVWDGTNYDELPLLAGCTGATAFGINNNSVIVGSCWDGTQSRAVIWEPVPEPSSIIALLCGISGIGGMMWRWGKLN